MSHVMVSVAADWHGRGTRRILSLHLASNPVAKPGLLIRILSLKMFLYSSPMTTPRDHPGELVLFLLAGEPMFSKTPYVISIWNGDVIEGMSEICELGKGDMTWRRGRKILLPPSLPLPSLSSTTEVSTLPTHPHLVSHGVVQ